MSLVMRLAGLALLGGALLLTWWGWHALDPGMLLLGSRLC